MDEQAVPLEEMTEMEAIAFRAFLRIYRVKNPLRRIDWQFRILAVGLIASVILAAMRTGFQFYVSSRLTAVRFLGGSNFGIDSYSILEAIVTMLGIEGLLIA